MLRPQPPQSRFPDRHFPPYKWHGLETGIMGAAAALTWIVAPGATLGSTAGRFYEIECLFTPPPLPPACLSPGTDFRFRAHMRAHPPD